MSTAVRFGFLVNPIAGIGGPSGQKGSDTEQARAAALSKGYTPAAATRARLALERMGPVEAHWLTGEGDMGERLLSGRSIGDIDVLAVEGVPTTAQSTHALVRGFIERGVDVVVFAGGDGTARDVASAVDGHVPILGIPAGVKMRSGCFAVTPSAAGAVMSRLARDGISRCPEVELLDAAPDGVGSVLLGYCTTPAANRLIQGPKSRHDDDESQRPSLVEEAYRRIGQDDIVVCGPGRGAKDVLARVGSAGTPLGVDVYDRRSDDLVADVDERTLFGIVQTARRLGRNVTLVVGVVGGQGILLGRGNQQLSARVVTTIGFENVIVLASTNKLAHLRSQPLVIDWEDGSALADVPEFINVVVGLGQHVRYRLSVGT